MEQMERTKDGAYRDASIDVGGAIKRIKDDDVVAGKRFLHSHRQVLFLGGNCPSPSRIAKNVAEDFVGDDIQLLLVLPLWTPLTSNPMHLTHCSEVCCFKGCLPSDNS
jgi:hypothetical protein